MGFLLDNVIWPEEMYAGSYQTTRIKRGRRRGEEKRRDVPVDLDCGIYRPLPFVKRLRRSCNARALTCLNSGTIIVTQCRPVGITILQLSD